MFISLKLHSGYFSSGRFLDQTSLTRQWSYNPWYHPKQCPALAKLPRTYYLERVRKRGHSRSLTSLRSPRRVQSLSRAQRHRARRDPLLPPLPPTPPRIFCVTKLSTPETRPQRPRHPPSNGPCGNLAEAKKPKEGSPGGTRCPFHPPFQAPRLPAARSLPLVGPSTAQPHTKKAAAITPSEGHPPPALPPPTFQGCVPPALSHSHTNAAARVRAHTHPNAAGSLGQESRPRAQRVKSPRDQRGPQSHTAAPRTTTPTTTHGSLTSRGSRVRVPMKVLAPPSPSSRLRTHTQKPPLCSAGGQYRGPSRSPSPSDGHNQHSCPLPVLSQPRSTDTGQLEARRKWELRVPVSATP